MSVPLILGHRGAAAKAPENTLPGLRLGMAEGADGFGVRRARPRRRHGGPAARRHRGPHHERGEGPLASYDKTTIADLDAGGGERIPLLDDVLGEFLERSFLAIEMKEVLPEAVLDDLANQFRQSLAARVVVASFESKAVERARDRLPAVPRALILPLDRALPPPALVNYLGLWGIFAREESIDERYVVDCRRMGLAVFAYTVNDPARAVVLAGLGVEGLISDDPGALRRVLPRPL